MFRRIKAGLYARRRLREMMGAQMQTATPEVMRSGSGYDALWKRGLEHLAVGDSPTKPLEQVACVYIAVSKITASLASVSYSLFTGKDRTEDHPLLTTFQRPNDAMSGTALFESTEMWLQMRGQAFWLVDGVAGSRDGGPSKMRIRVLDADRVKADVKDDELLGWKYKTQNLSVDEVVRFAYANPSDPFEGLSPLKAARLGYNLAYKSSRWQEKFYVNGGFPPFYLYLPKEAGNLGVEAKQLLKDQFREEYLGIRNAWKPPVLTQGAELRTVSISQRDAEWLATQKLANWEVFAVFHVPPSIAGYSEDANRSVSLEDKREFWGGKIRGDGQLIASVINATFIPRYWPSLRFAFDWRAKFSEVMPEEIRASIESMGKLWAMGVPAAEAAKIVGVEVDTEGKPWLEEGFLPFSVVPASSVGQEDPGLPDDEDKHLLARGTHWPKAERMRAGLWKSYTARTDRVERKMLGDWRGFLRWMRDEILARLRASAATSGSHPAIDALLRDDEASRYLPKQGEIEKQAVDRTKPGHLLAAREARASVAAELDLDLEAFNTLDPRVLQLLAERSVAVKVAAMNAGGRYRDALAEGIAKGESIDKLEERIAGLYRQEYVGQARTVARTETLSVFSKARVDTMSEAGIKKHEWLSARDEGVRESHQIDGEIRIIGDPFSNGLQWPLEWGADPALVINCRCIALPVVED